MYWPSGTRFGTLMPGSGPRKKCLPSGSGVPWHRIVRAGGRIAFAPGSADFARQRALLLEEGCTVADNGRVTAKAQLTGTLDEAIWGGWFG